MSLFEQSSVELLDVFGSDVTVVNSARVSFGKEVDEMTEGDERLIRYLCKHNHDSPFFHPQLRFRFRMPIWMAREWFRHTVGFSRNEISRRYVDTQPTFEVPDTLRKRSLSKKQGSLLEAVELNTELVDEMKDLCQKASDVYAMLLDHEVCPEQARMILPVNLMTEFYETGSLAAYARLCRLRISDDAQIEIRAVAEAVSRQIEPAFPVSWKYLSAKD